MLAFRPNDTGKPAEVNTANNRGNHAPEKPASSAGAALVNANQKNNVETIQPTDSNELSADDTRNNLQFDGDWRRLVDQLKLGLARALAQNCELAHFDESSIALTVPESQKHLLDASYQEKLRTAIQTHFGRKIQLKFDIGGTGNTPAVQINQEKAIIQSNAVSAIQQDDFVQTLVKDFGAQIIPSSIKPLLQ